MYTYSTGCKGVALVSSTSVHLFQCGALARALQLTTSSWSTPRPLTAGCASCSGLVLCCVGCLQLPRKSMFYFACVLILDVKPALVAIINSRLLLCLMCLSQLFSAPIERAQPCLSLFCLQPTLSGTVESAKAVKEKVRYTQTHAVLAILPPMRTCLQLHSLG